jgi:hypothetical protein
MCLVILHFQILPAFVKTTTNKKFIKLQQTKFQFFKAMIPDDVVKFLVGLASPLPFCQTELVQRSKSKR